MPKVSKSNKRKKQASSSEEENAASDASDSSGPADRNPPPGAKKGAGAAKKPAAAAAASAKTDGDPSWPLDKNRSVQVRSFKGSTYIDIREYYEKDGKQLPGKKGISLSVNQWNKLKSYIADVDKAVEEI